MMPTIKSCFQKTIHIWIAVGLLCVAALFFLNNQTKEYGYLLLVPYHSKPLDMFFICFTYLGDGIFILLLAVVAIILKYKWQGIAILVSYALSGLLSQVIKLVFPSPRPAVFFRALGKSFYEIPGVTLTKSMASFPSGHTASAFALMGILVLLYPRSKWNSLWLILSVGVGYSRIYLGNHFLADVLCGAVIGVFSGMATILLLSFFTKAKALVL